MLIEKYTIMLSSAILVPGVLGITLFIGNSFDFSSISLLDINKSTEFILELKNTVSLSSLIYILEFGLLSSIFLSQENENNYEYFIIYFSIIFPISYLVFTSIPYLIG